MLSCPYFPPVTPWIEHSFLDAGNLEATPLQDFGTMGLTEHPVQLSSWRLSLAGHVTQPLELTYEDIRSLPSVERKVLLICPGFFANHGRWKGVSMRALLDRSGRKRDATHVTFRGPKGRYESSQRFPMAEVLSDQPYTTRTFQKGECRAGLLDCFGAITTGPAVGVWLATVTRAAL